MRSRRYWVESRIGMPSPGLGNLGDLSRPVPDLSFPALTPCGLAVLDLPTNPPISKAIVVTTMNGELAVFTQSNGVINQTPMFRTIVEGSLGAFNSIVLANLVPAAPKPQLYIAGSSGIRRFDFQP